MSRPADLARGRFEAHDHGADRCVLLDEDGQVTEGPGFNLVVVAVGRLATPDAGGFEGLRRRWAVEFAREMNLAVAVRPVTVAELRDADEMLLITTADGTVPAMRADGRIRGERLGKHSRPSGAGAERSSSGRRIRTTQKPA